MGLYISACMLLTVFIIANGLQYTHDIAHRHANQHSRSSTGNADQKRAVTDECALCWFVSHQISPSPAFGSLLPQAAVQEHGSLLNQGGGFSCEEGSQCLLGNKDPPSGV